MMVVIIYFVYLIFFKKPKQEDVFIIEMTPTDDILDRLILSA